MMDIIFIAAPVATFLIGLLVGRLVWHKPITQRTLNAMTIEERSKIAAEAKQSLPKSSTPNG